MSTALTRVGVREFREDLAQYLDSPVPIAITRHGRTVGYFVPAGKDPDPQTILSYTEAVEKLQSLLESYGITEDDVVRELRHRRIP